MGRQPRCVHVNNVANVPYPGALFHQRHCRGTHLPQRALPTRHPHAPRVHDPAGGGQRVLPDPGCALPGQPRRRHPLVPAGVSQAEGVTSGHGNIAEREEEEEKMHNQ